MTHSIDDVAKGGRSGLFYDREFGRTYKLHKGTIIWMYRGYYTSWYQDGEGVWWKMVPVPFN